MPGYYWPLWRLVIGQDTFSALALILGPLTKELVMSPSFTVQTWRSAWYQVLRSMWHSSCYCMRHSWLTKFGVSCLNQLVGWNAFACYSISLIITNYYSSVGFIALSTEPLSQRWLSGLMSCAVWPTKDMFSSSWNLIDFVTEISGAPSPNPAGF